LFTNALIQQHSDIALIRKVYKLPVPNTANAKKGGGKGGGNSVMNGAPDEKERKELEVQILGIMALKGT